MKTFIILFVLAVLFVVGSAGAMRYFDKRGSGSKRTDKNDE
jgi:hypothetical protein